MTSYHSALKHKKSKRGSTEEHDVLFYCFVFPCYSGFIPRQSPIPPVILRTYLGQTLARPWPGFRHP
jgi:hypothetical protein